MQCELYSEDDAILITVRSGQSSTTKRLDDRRYVGVNEQDELVWVSLLYISEGVDLDMFTGEDLETASRFMDERNIKVLV